MHQIADPQYEIGRPSCQADAVRLKYEIVVFKAVGATIGNLQLWVVK